MMYYIIGFFVLILTVAANIKPQKRQLPIKKNVWDADRLFILIFAAVLFLILVLQDSDSNGDLQGYRSSYSVMGFHNFAYFQRNWIDMKDPFYYFCIFCFSRLGFGFYAWKSLVSFIFVFNFYNLVKRYSVNPAMSFIVFLTLGLYSFSMSGLRQTLALAVIMCTYPCLKDKKFLKFVLTVLIAALFHRTALIFLVAYPIYRLRAKMYSILIIIIGGVFTLLNVNSLTQLYISVAGVEDEYSAYLDMDNGLSVSGIIIWGCIWLFCTVFLYRKKSNSSDPLICNLMLVSFFMRIISSEWIAEFFRIAMYFSLFECLAIADACASKEKSTFVVRIKTAGVSVALLLYYFVSPDYNYLSYILR